MAVDRRWALDLVVQRWGRLPCGEPHRARAPRPSAPRQRLSAAPVSSMVARVGSGEWSGEQWGHIGSGRGQGAGRGQGPTPRGSRRPTINPSLRKIAPRRAAQPLRHQERGGVGAGPHEIERRRRKLAKNGKNDLENFPFLGVFGRVFGRAPAPKTPSAARTAWKRLLYRRS